MLNEPMQAVTADIDAEVGEDASREMGQWGRLSFIPPDMANREGQACCENDGGPLWPIGCGRIQQFAHDQKDGLCFIGCTLSGLKQNLTRNQDFRDFGREDFCLLLQSRHSSQAVDHQRLGKTDFSCNFECLGHRNQLILEEGWKHPVSPVITFLCILHRIPR